MGSSNNICKETIMHVHACLDWIIHTNSWIFIHLHYRISNKFPSVSSSSCFKPIAYFVQLKSVTFLWKRMPMILSIVFVVRQEVCVLSSCVLWDFFGLHLIYIPKLLLPLWLCFSLSSCDLDLQLDLFLNIWRTYSIVMMWQLTVNMFLGWQ